MPETTSPEIATLSTSKTPPTRPSQLPYPTTLENILKLENYLLDKFSETAFNRASPFPAINSLPAHIHLSITTHTPITITICRKKIIMESLDHDVQRGIITPVPIGTPVEWCSPMVVTSKKDGNPRKTVNLQYLNAQCLCKTHHTQSPLQAASSIPPNTWKTILDAVDGYHAITLHKESQPLTTFITEWGQHMYLHLPQGYLASGDAYTRQFDELMKDVCQKIKIDDTLLYNHSIDEAFYHMWNFLQLCVDNDIVINASKFKFCRQTVEFAGSQITPTGIAPSEKLLVAIKEFPKPENITDARSWFGLINQVAWRYSLSPIMAPFSDLVKHHQTFTWNENLDTLFLESKKIILKKITEDIHAFNPSKQTCLQTDWSRNGIGYLLQKHCSCEPTNNPICCAEGWKLVYARSYFTSECESWYSPTEGKALAVSWALDNAHLFVLG